MSVRVLVADDHGVTRVGLTSLLRASGMEVVGEAVNGREAVRLATDLAPDVVIMDVAMPELNGIDALNQLRRTCPRARAVILSMHADAEHVYRALAAGACGYLLKESDSEEVVAAVRSASLGRQYLSRALQALERRSNARPADSPLTSLSARERQVLQLVVEGRSSAEIAALVHLSPKSVDTYRSRLMRKLGVTDITALVKFAVLHGLTPPA